MTDDQNLSRLSAAAGWWSRFLSWLDGFAEGSYGSELDALRDRVEVLERARANMEQQPKR